MIRRWLGIALAVYSLTVPQPFSLLCVAALLYVWGSNARARNRVQDVNVEIIDARTEG